MKNFIKKLFQKSEIETGVNNPVLRRKAKPIKKITPAVLELAKKMTEIIRENRYVTKGFVNVGLAAPQIGHSIRMIVLKNWPKDEIIILINPQITRLCKNTMIMQESCTSLPDVTVEVKRPTRVTVRGLNAVGKKIEIRAKGFLARIIQHEVDHLNGILIVDRAKS